MPVVLNQPPRPGGPFSGVRIIFGAKRPPSLPTTSAATPDSSTKPSTGETRPPAEGSPPSV